MAYHEYCTPLRNASDTACQLLWHYTVESGQGTLMSNIWTMQPYAEQPPPPLNWSQFEETYGRSNYHTYPRFEESNLSSSH